MILTHVSIEQGRVAVLLVLHVVGALVLLSMLLAWANYLNQGICDAEMLTRLWGRVQAGMTDPSGFIMFPLVIHCMDLVVSAAGIMSIGSKSTATPLQPVEDPYTVIKVSMLTAITLHDQGF